MTDYTNPVAGWEPVVSADKRVTMSQAEPLAVGTPVLLDRGGAEYLGQVHTVYPDDTDPAYGVVTTESAGRIRYATPDQVTPLPVGTPVFRTEALVQVRDDTPLHPGRRGNVLGPHMVDGALGYYLRLCGAGEQVWVPAAALAPAGKGGAS